MSVSLREITAKTVSAVLKLKVAPEQQRFVATNAESLSEALFSEEAWYRAVYQEEQLAGFVMLHDESQSRNPPEKPKLTLWRLMVDHQFQRQGIGRAILEQVVEHALSKKCFDTLYTSFVPGPEGPEKFYLSLGFVPNGEIDQGETVVLLDLRPKST